MPALSEIVTGTALRRSARENLIAYEVRRHVTVCSSERFMDTNGHRFGTRCTIMQAIDIALDLGKGGVAV